VVVLWALWSLVAWPLAALWMVATMLLCLPMLPFRALDRFRTALLFGLLSNLTRLCFVRVRVTADPGFDPDRRSVYCMNHTSVLDPFLMIHVVPHAYCGVVNSVQLNMPVYGWVLRLAHAIPVGSRSEGQTADIARHFADRVARGLSVVICPEAHRTVDGKLREFKRGAFYLARNAGLPIVPVAVRGLFRVLPKGTWIIRGGTVDVHLGPQIDPAGYTGEQIGALAARCKEYVGAWVERGEAIPDAVRVLTPPAGRA